MREGSAAVCLASPEPVFGCCFSSLSSLYTMQSDVALHPCDGKFEEKGYAPLSPALTFLVLAGGSPKSHRAASWETSVSWNHIDTGCGDM